MRSLAVNGNRQILSRRIFLCFLVYVCLHWITGFCLYFAKLGVGYQAVVEYYLGCEEKFMQPRSVMGLLEVTHFHLFSAAVLLLTVTHLLLSLAKEPRRAWIYICFTSALLDIASGWLVRFVHPWFGWLKIVSFWSMQISLGYIIVLLGYYLLFSPKNTPDSSVKGKQPLTL